MTEEQKKEILAKVNDILADIVKVQQHLEYWQWEQGKRNEHSSISYVLSTLGYEIVYNCNGTQAIDIVKK